MSISPTVEPSFHCGCRARSLPLSSNRLLKAWSMSGCASVGSKIPPCVKPNQWVKAPVSLLR